MKNDPYIKELFNNYRPQLNDSEEFMQQLTRKLDTVEQVRSYCQHERRRLRRSIVVAFLSGIPVGIAMTVFFFFHPLSLHLTAPFWTLPLLRFFAHNASMLISGLVVISLSAGVAYICTLFYNLFSSHTSPT